MSAEKSMLMAELTYTLLSISTKEKGSEYQLSQTYVDSTQTLAAHAELLSMVMITQSRMEMSLQEDWNGLSPDVLFYQKMSAGAQSSLHRIENNFLNLCESWLLLISPSVIQALPDMLTGNMLLWYLNTPDQLWKIHGSYSMRTRNLAASGKGLVKSWMDNEVSQCNFLLLDGVSPSLGPLRDHGGGFRGSPPRLPPSRP